MEFLEIDDDNLAVYDNESGDTHYIDTTGKSILEILVGYEMMKNGESND